MSAQTLYVLGALTHRELCGREIADATNLASGTMYPILVRLEASAWVSSRWEEGDPAVLGRPRRRFYKITEDGRRKSRLALQELLAAWP